MMLPRAPHSRDAQPVICDDSETVVYFVPNTLQPTPLPAYDTDSDTSSTCSASTMATEEAREYFHDVGGRMYPLDPELPIFFPQDELESHRLDHQHLALKLCIGSNFVGPLSYHLPPCQPPKRVLDVGTQQGSWVQEMAVDFPHVDFVSVDVSPMAAHIPRKNITFEVYELYAGIAEPDASFDVVHMRHMAFKVANYPLLIRELHRVLKPGGLLIAGELENEAYGAAEPHKPLGDVVPRLSRALKLLREALSSQGVMHDAGRRLASLLADSELFGKPAFADITPRTYAIPATPWPNSPTLRESGQQSLLAYRQGWPSLAPLLTTRAGLSPDDAHRVIRGALAEYYTNPALPLVTNYHTVWAIKV